ncbi:MAG: hypothetical protein HY923_06115 [Elusimicrobia bacterium]|nr:hypothetical protein [Elusimicrobiota bacterium]
MSPRFVFALVLSISAASPARAESCKSWAARGSREEREKDPKAAAASYTTALSLWEDGDGAAAKAKVLCARGSIREKDGDDAEAINDFGACLAIDKKNAKVFHRRGLLYVKAGKTSAAIGDFYKAIALDIRFGQAYLDRARAYESQNELGFAREDYRHACEFGVKAACAKAKALAPKTSSKKKGEAKGAPKTGEPESEPEANEAGGAPGAVEEAPAAELVDETPAPKKKKSSGSGYYLPKYRDCLEALNTCVDAGDSFGTCVSKAPNCDKKTVRGCCPATCLKAYQKAINRSVSEAEAFREHFAPDASCGIPPKIEEED